MDHESHSAAGRNFPPRAGKCHNCGGSDHDLRRDGCPEPLQHCKDCGKHGHLDCGTKNGRSGKRPRGAAGGGSPAKKQNQGTAKGTWLAGNRWGDKGNK